MIQPDRAEGFGGHPLPNDNCYIQISMARMQLKFDGFLFKEYYPVLHSFVELSRQGEDRVMVPFVAGPAHLAELASHAEQLIVNQSVPVLGPTPYLGGDVKLAAGLCAAQSQDYLDGLLGVASASLFARIIW